MSLLVRHGLVNRKPIPIISVQAYADIVEGIDNLLAYWRCSNDQTLIDEQPGERDGTFTGSPTLVNSLPAVSDQALDFPGEVFAEVPHDAGLLLNTFSVSGWLKVNSTPANVIGIWSKEASGLNDGDLSLILDETLSLGAQFQSASSQISVSTNISIGVVYHWAIIVGTFGFDFFVNGKHIGRNTSFTNGWINNTNPIQFAKPPWTNEEFIGVLDEVALYSSVLTDENVITLSQVKNTPIADEPDLLVTELQAVIFDAFDAATCVGRKSDLIIEFWDGDSWEISITTTHGSVSINGNNDIQYEANEVSNNEIDSFQYRITDVNGTSATATISVTVQDSAGAGTLIYEWAPLVSDVDDGTLENPGTFKPLTDRDWNEITALSNWTNSSRATTGSNLPKEMMQVGGQNHTALCYNRAPAASSGSNAGIAIPSLEIRTGVDDDAPMLFNVRLFEKFGGSPRHLRFVIELKTCKSSDDNTYKPQGKGTTSGNYPNWNASRDQGGGDTNGGKYFCGLASGDRGAGSGQTNWWNESNFPIDRASYRISWSLDDGILFPYTYHFDRSSQFGGGPSPSLNPVEWTPADTGIAGVWHRVEVEVKLADPATVPDNARRSNPETEPDHTGNGFQRCYITKDIDNELGGGVGTKTMVADRSDIINHCKFDDVGTDDNMHIDAALSGLLFFLIYGGAGGFAKAEVWAWIRRAQVYQLD